MAKIYQFPCRDYYPEFDESMYQEYQDFDESIYQEEYNWGRKESKLKSLVRKIIGR